jgi:DNA-binding transcriptional ArsR family regulator
VEILGGHSRWTYWTERLPNLRKHRTALPRLTPTAQPTTARRLSDDDVAELASRYEAGATVDELAARFKIHRATVSRHMDRLGIARRQRGLDDDQARAAVSLYQDGWSLARLGVRFEVEAHTVRLALVKRGVRMRDTHGRER